MISNLFVYAYTGWNGCVNNAVASINVLPCTGIGNNNEFIINIYPNPTEQIIYITGLENGTYNFSIINVLGQVIRSGKLPGDGMIDLGIISSGTYYLQIDNRFWKIVKK